MQNEVISPVIERETERPAAAEDHRQGDILEFDYPNGITGPRLGVVINADCDLENKKTDGIIAYLPMYSFEEYLEIFWAPRHIQNASVEASDRLIELTRAGDNGRKELAELMALHPPDVLAEKLQQLVHVGRNDRPAINQAVHKLACCLSLEGTALDRFSRLCKLQKDPGKHARTQFESAKKELGDGHFFLSELVGEENIGFVIRMRRIYSLSENAMFKSTAEQRSRSNGSQTTAVRIARLTPLYRFKVSQIFAQQFSRIGLPNDVTALGSLAIEDLVSKLKVA